MSLPMRKEGLRRRISLIEQVRYFELIMWGLSSPTKTESTEQPAVDCMLRWSKRENVDERDTLFINARMYSSLWTQSNDHAGRLSVPHGLPAMLHKRDFQMRQHWGRRNPADPAIHPLAAFLESVSGSFTLGVTYRLWSLYPS